MLYQHDIILIYDGRSSQSGTKTDSGNWIFEDSQRLSGNFMLESRRVNPFLSNEASLRWLSCPPSTRRMRVLLQPTQVGFVSQEQNFSRLASGGIRSLARFPDSLCGTSLSPASGDAPCAARRQYPLPDRSPAETPAAQPHAVRSVPMRSAHLRGSSVSSLFP
jgi:hypothetical protein